MLLYELESKSETCTCTDSSIKSILSVISFDVDLFLQIILKPIPFIKHAFYSRTKNLSSLKSEKIEIESEIVLTALFPSLCGYIGVVEEKYWKLVNDFYS